MCNRVNFFNTNHRFLWVKYQLLQLCEAANKYELIDRLHEPPHGLEEMYEDIWKKIGLLDKTQRDWAYRTISWILHATGPLSPECLLEATAIEPNNTKTFDGSRKASDIGYLVRACKHLIIQDAQGRVRFMHHSVQEFAKSRPEVRQLKDVTAEVCLIALSHSPEGAPYQWHARYSRSNDTFYNHAVKNWEKYLRGLNNFKILERAVKNFLLDEDTCSRWIKRRLAMDHAFRYQASRQGILSDPSHVLNSVAIAIYFNLPKLVKHLLKTQPEVRNHIDPGTWQLVYLAALAGSTRVVEIPTGVGVNPNALQAAAYGGNMAMAKILLKAGVDFNAQGGHYGNALQAAVSEKKMSVMKVLLEAGANVNTQGGYYGNALQAAAYRSNVDMVKILLKAGADVNARGGRYMNALQAAASRENMDIVKILIEAGANVNAQGGYYGNALRAAISRGAVDIEGILVKAGAVDNYSDSLPPKLFTLQSATLFSTFRFLFPILLLFLLQYLF